MFLFLILSFTVELKEILAFTKTQEKINSPNFAFIHVNVIPMDGEKVLEDQTVLVAGDKIIQISPSSTINIVKGIQVIDGKGSFLMPGLADMHVHIRNSDELINYLAYGVTTIMHMGGSNAQGRRNLLYNQEISKGKRIGPNIYTTGRIFDGDPPASGGAYRISRPELARKLVREMKKNGFDFIKIYNNVNLPVFKAIVGEGNLVGLPVVGHITRKFDPLIALNGGQDMVVHSEEFFFTYFKGPRSTKDIDKEYRPDYSLIQNLVDVIKKNNVVIVPNLSYAYTDFVMWDDLENLFSDPEMDYISPTIIRNEFKSGNINRRSNIENFIYRDQLKYILSQELTRQFQKAGVLQLLGTDATQAGLFPGKSAHRELRELVKVGLSNYETLSIGTRNAGIFVEEHMPKKGKFGQIKTGFRADLILVDKNPLEDVRNIKLISGVMVQGRWIDKENISQLRKKISDKYKKLKNIETKLVQSILTNTTEKEMSQFVKIYAGNNELLKAIESSINNLGYTSISKKEMIRAINLFELNTKYFPKSANTWDSYAEAYLTNGDKKNAIKYYKKALEVNPNLPSARNQLRALLNKK